MVRARLANEMLRMTSLFSGAFLAVDWALALSVLPEGADTAKDMGIWHIAFVSQFIHPYQYSMQLWHWLLF
jgi:hypothetical protein